MSHKQTRAEKSSKEFQEELQKHLKEGKSLPTAIKKARKVVQVDWMS